MKLIRFVLAMAFILLIGQVGIGGEVGQVKEKLLEAKHGVTVKVRMEGPYTAEAPLQIVCYFKYTPEGVKRMSGASVELDKELGGVIGSLRARGEFVGDEGESLVLIPPKDSIKAGALLLIGLGAEDDLSLEVMERVGRVSLREAARRRPGCFRPVDSRSGQLEVGSRRRGRRGSAGRPAGV